MPRALLFITVTVLLGLGTSCEQSAPKQPAPTVPVLVQVFRDRYFAADLAQANAQFARSSPSVRTGRSVVLEVKDDVPYWDIPTRLRTFAPDVLILYSQGFAPDDPAIRNQLGAAQLVCGTHPAFISTSVSGEEREGAQAYLSFLTSHCIGTPPAQPTSPQQAQQTDEDEHRPSCSSRECKQIKAFLKSRYCGEAPFGDGPDDGCDIRGRKKTGPGTKITAAYSCRYDSKGEYQCQTQGSPSAEVRTMLLREMRRVGLPQGDEAEKEVRFTVLESDSGWSLMAADYDHISGTDLTLCQVIIVVDQTGKLHVVRKVPLRKTNADAPEVTTWSPVDLADVGGDGNMEVILEGDAYEDHWLEVVSINDG